MTRLEILYKITVNQELVKDASMFEDEIDYDGSLKFGMSSKFILDAIDSSLPITFSSCTQYKEVAMLIVLHSDPLQEAA